MRKRVRRRRSSGPAEVTVRRFHWWQVLVALAAAGLAAVIAILLAD